MSKIHEHIKGKETPEAVRNLLQDFVKDFESRRSDIWIREVKNKDSKYHRQTLLKQGRCDFDNPTHELTSDELICLYNYYYFPMHFQSSYWLYNLLFKGGLGKIFISNLAPVFIDYGCGTLSSSIAFSCAYDQVFSNFINNPDYLFNETFKQHLHLGNEGVECREFNQTFYMYEYNNSKDIFDLTKTSNWIFLPNNVLLKDNIGYIFCDLSKNVLKYSCKLFGSSEHFPYIDYHLWTEYPAYAYYYSTFVADNFFTTTYDLFDIDFLKKSIYAHINSQYTNKHPSIIINFSYLFASKSLIVDILVDIVKQLICEFNNCSVCIVNQNPDRNDLNTKWEEFKEKVPLKSIAKDVAPIKHYGGSTVRYEVLFKSMFDDILNDVEVSTKK